MAQAARAEPSVVRSDKVPAGFVTRGDSFSKLRSLADSPVRRASHDQEGDLEDETSELSAVERWAPTRVDEDDSAVEPWVPEAGRGDDEDSDDSGVEDSPYVPRLPGAADESTSSTVGTPAPEEDDETSLSEYMIRVNTQTDLAGENPFAFFSPARVSDSVTSGATETPPKQQHQQQTPPKLAVSGGERSPSKKHVPSASLRIQHNDMWLSQFILPMAADEAKLKRLSAVGTSSQSLTPTKLVEKKEISTLRFNVENTFIAVQALELQLEQDLAAAKPLVGEEEFLKLVARCLNLRKQALVACLQAAQRASQPQPPPQ